jgi:hypothetical protein
LLLERGEVRAVALDAKAKTSQLALECLDVL